MELDAEQTGRRDPRISRLRLLSVSVAVMVAVAVSACGGGGGSGGGANGGGGGTGSGYGNSLPPAAGPGDVENFFPVAAHDAWNYYATMTTNGPANGPPTFMDTVTVTGTRTVLGVAASVFLESDSSGTGAPVEGYYYKSAGGLAFLGTNDATDTITPSLVPYQLARYPLAVGKVAQFSKTGLNAGEDLDGDGRNETIDVAVTTAISGFEPLTIGLATFPRTVKSIETQTGNVILSTDGTKIPYAATATRWAAPGVGVVRTTQVTRVQSITADETMEARGYVVGGTPHGFGAVLTIPGTVAQTYTTSPALAGDGTNFLEATETPAGLVAQVFTDSGTLLGTATITGTVGPAYPVAAFDGTNYWVTFTPYSDGTSGSVTQVLAHRLSTTGALQEPGPLLLAGIGASQMSIGFTALAFGPGSGLLVYTAYNGTTNQHELWGSIVYPDGTTGAGGPFAIATDDSTHLYPAVVFDGTNYLVTWQQLAGSGATVGNIFATRVAPSGGTVDASPLMVASAPNGQYQPSVAFDGTNYLIVWQDLRNDPNGAEIYGARVAPGASLALLDGPAASGGFAIATGGTVMRGRPRVEFNGNDYLVAWTSVGYAVDAQGVQAVRVTTAGAPAVPSTRAIPVSGAPLAATNAVYEYPVLARRGNSIGALWRLVETPAPTLQASVFEPF